jgi:hypothetical protein
MAKYIQIGALVEKEHGLEAYHSVSTSKGVVYAFLETGRSNDLFSEKQFGEFGEAAIITMIVEAKQKSHVLGNLAEKLKIDNREEGFVFESAALLRCS